MGLGRRTLAWPGCVLAPLEEPAQGTDLLGDWGDPNLEVLNGCCWVSHLGHCQRALGASAVGSPPGCPGRGNLLGEDGFSQCHLCEHKRCDAFMPPAWVVVLTSPNTGRHKDQKNQTTTASCPDLPLTCCVTFSQALTSLSFSLVICILQVAVYSTSLPYAVKQEVDQCTLSAVSVGYPLFGPGFSHQGLIISFYRCGN